MKRICLSLVVVATGVLHAWAGESSLTTTFQPLDGLGSGRIQIVPVTCHDWYAHSGQPTALGLVSARNVPPTNNPQQATQDINLASVCRLRFSAADIQTNPGLTLNAEGFNVPKRFSHSPEHVLRASLECLRRCLPELLRPTPVVLQCDTDDREWMEPIIREFNLRDRTKVYFAPES